MEDGGHRVSHSSFIAPESQCKDSLNIQIHFFFLQKINILKGSYDAISSFPFSLECYKLIVHR